MNNAPLGVFDSGIGGLTVARALFERLPHESVIYFGDTARVPYGPKSPDTVRRYSAEILAYLLHRGVKAVVVACNTSTAHALGYLQSHSSVPVVGVIEPGARAAVAATRTGTIGVIGTAGTIASGAYERAIKALRPDARVYSQPCPLFVPLVEEGWFEHPAAELIARDYLAPLQRAKVDVLVLGCTHYPLLKPLLARVMAGKPDVKLVDSAEETATAVSKELERLNLLANGGAHDHRFVVSDDEPHFRKVGALFLGAKLKQVEVLGIVGEMPREQIRDPEADGRVQEAEHGDGERVAREPVHERAAPVLLRESIAVRDEGASPVQLQFGCAAEELNPQIAREKRAAPTVVIAAHERDRHTARADLLQLGDGGEMFTGNDARILEPEVEEIAHHHQMIVRLGHLVEKGVQRRPDGGRHLTEMGVRYDDHAGHGPSLGIWNHTRKRITVVL